MLWVLALFAWGVLPLVALALALRARGEAAAARTERAEARALLEARLAELEARLRRLEGTGPPGAEAGTGVAAAPPAPPPAPVAVTPPPPPVPTWTPLPEGIGAPAGPPPPGAPPSWAAEGRDAGGPPEAGAAAGTAPPSRRLDLEQRIGARWTTWAGVVAILFALGFFLRWALERDLLGPAARVAVGAAAGCALLGAGLRLGRRPDLPYLSEGLAGGGLGALYLTLYAAHVFYGYLGAVQTFYLMFLVTVAGAVVSLASGRQVTAVLALLGGLLTPVLLAGPRPDERVLLGYLLVLDLLVLAVARYRAWLALPRLAWVGTALLVLPALVARPGATWPATRLVLLTALFGLFVAVPLAREWLEGRRYRDADILLAAANGAGYAWAVYETLERWRPQLEAPWALGLAVFYAAVAAGYRRRVPEDEPTLAAHLGLAATAVSVGLALALDGPWLTLGWAAQGVVFLSVAPRLLTPAPVWAGLGALLLAALRAALVDPERAVDPYGWPLLLSGALVVGAQAWGGRLARSAREDQLRWLTPHGLAGLLWILGALAAAAVIWRQTRGLWPGALLALEVVVLAWLARRLAEPRAPTFVVAVPVVAGVLLLRLFVEDARPAREAAVALMNAHVGLRLAAAAALGLAARWLGASAAEAGSARVARVLGAAAGVVPLGALTLGWVEHQELARQAARAAGRAGLAAALAWQTQVGLSVLWTLYGALALGWGFWRGVAAVRYAALGLLGLVVVKVFVVDLAAVETAYRIVSFLVLGLVLLGISALYQRRRRG